MINPRYPRTTVRHPDDPPHPMELPRLYSDQSPWNQIIKGSDAFPDGVIPESDNQRIMLVAFDVMRELSWEALAKTYKKRDKLQSSGPLPDPVKERNRLNQIDALQKKIVRLLEALEIKNGLDRGGIQTPSIGCVDYAFPIFPVRREDGVRLETEIPMITYHNESWKPFNLQRRSEGEEPNKKWFAEAVPLPAPPFRPAGPESDEAAGCVILFDNIKHEEWNFFQVTTSIDPLVHEGGHEGTQILQAGSLAKFDTQGTGARLPPDSEPLGSSRATGLPYLGGLLVPEDFQDGKSSIITHALAFTFPRSRYFPFRAPTDPPDFIYPAVRSETSHFIQNPYALAAGMRIRLKSVIKCADCRELPQDQWTALPPAVRIFFTALRDYGAYLVDGGFGFGLAAEDRETAVIDPNIVPLLTNHPIEDNSTPWESLIQTIDDYLNWELFRANKPGEPDFGLSLGFLTKTQDGYEFWTNFEVVAPLDVPT
ncbi:MAG: hypothetical protein WCJ09_28865 [Planctomycetota bacterium]